MRRWLVAGNWKMNNTIEEAIKLATTVRENTYDIKGGDIILAPPYTLLHGVKEVIEGSNIFLAAQNMFYEDKGAYTGEISPAMIKDAGCTYVIIGHSERRKYFGETDEVVNLKTKKALKEGLKPIVCVGETDVERDKGITSYVVGIQVRKALYGIEFSEDIVIAYEPVWAIGTGRNATSEQAEEVHRFIRGILKELYGTPSERTRILYGGSVTADNIGELINMENIDGALVGGASLKSDSFVGIIRKVSENRKC
ncbi:MAG: triose-phosphate isomerase [Syntrophorhabdaceae bacterium]|nr:triose-phosphate isomerase [Syntrophorhabdaceae bacterium]